MNSRETTDVLVVTVEFAIKPGALERFLPLIAENAGRSLADEQGCLQFDVCVAAVEPSQVFLYEVYADAAAFDAHLETPHYRQFEQAAAALIETRRVQRLRRIVPSPSAEITAHGEHDD